MRAQGLFLLLALDRLAFECIVDRLAERVPQFLFLPAVHRHGLGFSLPTLLQGPYPIDTQRRRLAQCCRLCDHGLAPHHAGLLQGFQWRGCLGDRRMPLRLQLGKQLLANMARVMPTIAELVQDARKTTPVVVQRGGIGSGPGVDFLDQCQALRPVDDGIGLGFLDPAFDNLVRLVARLVEAFPQAMIGHTALIGLFPLLAKRPQRFLHLATTDGLAGGSVQQTFGLGHQFLA